MRSAFIRRAAGAAGVLVGFASLFSPALAADIVRPVVPVVVAPAFTWTGCHIGIHGGWGWGEKEFSSPSTIFGDQTVDVRLDGGLVGGQVGCDKQLHNGWVFGVEGSGSWTNIRGSRDIELTTPMSGDGVLSTRVEWLASITARIGRALGRHLWYVKGGAAFEREEHRYAVSFEGQCPTGRLCITPGSFGLSGEAIHAGWTIGAGFEWALHSSWSLKVEYNYYDFATERIAFWLPPGGPGGGLGFPVDVTPILHAVTVGLNHRF
jgi:outer membrane immunogenic protein